MTSLKLLLIDLTRLGGSAATGALKQAVFGTWSNHEFAHFYGSGRQLILRTGASSVLQEKTFHFDDDDIVRSCLDFEPDVILYRPVADNSVFHDVAMRVIKTSQVPLALWLMDDWPERLKVEDIDRFEVLNNDLRWLFGRSSVNFAISEGMASAFGKRYEVPFGVIHNGVDSAEWPVRRRSMQASTIVVRYAGSLAPDTTRDSILNVVRIVSQMASEGMPIRFEGQTQKVWLDRYGNLFHDLPGVSLCVAKLPVKAYRQWLCDADIILIGYNFDDETRRYLQFSFANKVPEALASGAAVFAYGPQGLQTIDYLSQHKIAKVVSTPNADILKAALTELMENKQMRRDLGISGRAHAFDKFDLKKQRNKMITTLRDISKKWVPPSTVLDRHNKAQFDECRFVYEALEARSTKGVMIDVGAHVGSSLIKFAKADWTVWAFEPDTKNREKLIERLKNRSNVYVINKAVSDNSSSNVAFFSSDVSTGISGLTAFHESHQESARIDTTTLDIFIADHKVTEVDFLKIDVEGHEMDVLNGIDFDKVKPRAIVAEYEDDKTKAHGYLMPDLAQRFVDAGYVVFVSEWHPIERYGVKHSWKRIRRYPCDSSSQAWGNLVAFLDEPEPKMLRRAFQRSLVAESKIEVSDSQPSGRDSMKFDIAPAVGPRSAYVRVAEYMIHRHPVVAQFLRFGVWSLRTLQRRAIGIGGLLFITILMHIIALSLRPDLWLLWAVTGGFVISGALAFLVVGYARLIFGRKDAIYNRHIKALEGNTKRLSQQLRKTQSVLARVERRGLGFEALTLKRMKGLEDHTLNQINENTVAITSHFKKWMSQTRLKTQERLQKYQELIEKNDGQQNKRHVKSTQTADAIKHQLSELNRKTANLSRETSKGMQASRLKLARMSTTNAALVRPHERLLSEENLRQFQAFWIEALGLELSRSQLGYYAHKICLAEDAAAGRLAAPVATMLLRLLASHSLKGQRIEILEIGTLFGIGAGCLFKLRAPYEREVHLTLLDPMEGYYEHGSLDPVTGVPVSEEILRDNLSQLGIPDDRWRLIKKLSTDSLACEMAAERNYDMIIIDGDHTVEGVARDFELYGDLVKPEGLLIFDDYDTKDWPDIKPYVDETIKSDDRWRWVGGEFRTGIFRRIG